MSNVRYFKLDDGSLSATDLQTIIAQLDAIIAELMTTALRAVIKGDVAEYDIETGQTIQRVKYSNQETLMKSILGYKKLRQLYANECIPSKVKLVPSRNFR